MKRYTTVIEASELLPRLDDPDWLVIDCRCVLGEPNRGRELYQERHIQAALHADLERDLSGVVVPGSTGRHPLPEKEALEKLFGSWGIQAHTQVVAYDGGSGQLAAARLWWLLRWAGHENIAVLNGGFPHWCAQCLPTSDGEAPARHPVVFRGRFRDDWVVEARNLEQQLGSGSEVLVDSRAADRYRGDNETIDPVAGHIPGARCLPFTQTLDAEGRLRSRDQLAEHFSQLPNGGPNIVFYCGSGVTAALNVLAYVHAGLPMPRLYAGSWSDWITDLARPVARGG